MITGISMGQETCLVLGQVSLNLLYWKKAPDEHMWSGWRLTRKRLTSRPDHSMARTLRENVKKCSAEGEAKVVE